MHVLKSEKFYTKMVNMKIRKGAYDVPNLSSFLAHQNDTSKVDIKRLATATGEFLRNQYLQSFGTTKKKALEMDKTQTSKC